MSSPTYEQTQQLITAIKNIQVSVPAGSGGGGGSSVDRELVVTTYFVKNAFSGAAVGDTVTATQVLDVSGSTPSTIVTVWRNQTQAADLTNPPSAANLTLLGASALTDAQLRAAALTIALPADAATNSKLEAIRALLAAALPLPQGAATDAKLEAVRALLAAALPLPQGAATDAKLEAVRALLAASLPLPQGAATDAKVEAVRALLAAALPLPQGASTSAKQDTMQTALGAPADPAATTADNTPTSMIAQLKQIVNKLPTGSFFVEPAAALAATGVFNGNTHDTGASAGGLHPFAYFNAFALSDQSGTLYIDGSPDGATNNWTPLTVPAAGAISPNVPVVLSMPVFYKFYRARVVNGSTAEGSLKVATSFTGA